MTYIWLGILIASVVGEAATPVLISIWFMPAALVALIFALIGLPIGLQIGLFFAISLALLIFMKPVVQKLMQKSPIQKTNAEALLEQTGVVMERIDNLAGTGLIKVHSQIWSARSLEERTVIEVGALVTVKEIRGVKLICKKEDAPV